jgi:hypothetical protein
MAKPGADPSRTYITREELHRHSKRALSILSAVLVLMALLLVAIGLRQVDTSASDSELHAVAVAQCYRVDFLRWEIDLGRLERYRVWQREHQPALTKAEDFLPFTNCKKALAQDGAYSPARPFSFTRLTGAQIRLFANTRPPKPYGIYASHILMGN